MVKDPFNCKGFVLYNKIVVVTKNRVNQIPKTKLNRNIVIALSSSVVTAMIRPWIRLALRKAALKPSLPFDVREKTKNDEKKEPIINKKAIV